MLRRFLPVLCLFALPAMAEDGFDWRVAPDMQAAGPAHQGVVAFQQGGLWGLMGADGQWVVAPRYQAVGQPGAGRFPVQEGGKWGVVDLAGQVATPFEFDAIGKPDLYTPMLWQGQWWAIGPTGQADPEPLPFDTLVGNDGTCMVGTAGGVPVAVHRGEAPAVTSPDGVSAMGGPANGIVPLVIGGMAGHLDCTYGAVKNGAAGFAEVRGFHEDLAAARVQDFWGFIGPWDSFFEISDQFLAAGDFAEGLAPVQDSGGLWGYIDRSGAWVIAPRFQWAEGFSEGLAVVGLDGAAALITADGAEVAGARFQAAGRQSGGVIAVQAPDGWGLIAVAATDPATRDDLGLQALAEAQAGRVDPPGLQPSNPHYYFFQDIASVHSASFSADAKVMVTVLALGDASEIGLWDRESQRLIRKLPVPQAVQAVLLPGRNLLAVGLATGHVLVLDAVTGEELRRIHPHRNAVIDMVLSPDGRWLATADAETVRMWDAVTGEAGPAVAEKAHKLRFAAGSDQLFAGTRRGGLVTLGLDGAVLARVDEGAEIEYGDGPQDDAVSELALAPDGTLASLRVDLIEQADGFYAPRSVAEITRPDGTRTELLLSDSDALSSILSIDLSADGQRLAYAGMAAEGEWLGRLEIRDLATGGVVYARALGAGDGMAASIPSVDRLAFTPEGQVLVIGMEGRGIVTLDPAEDRVVADFGDRLAEGQGGIATLEGSDYLQTDGTGKVWVWDLAAGALRGRVDLGEGAAFGPEEMQELRDGRLYLYSGLDSGQVGAYDLATGQAVPLDEAEQARLASEFDFDATQPYPEAVMAQLMLLTDGAPAVALAGGRLAVTREAVGLQHVHDLATGEKIADFLATPDGEWLVLTPEGFFAASPNGAKLVSVSVGMRAFAVDQVYQALYRPDLVAAKLAGDPDGTVAKAAAGLDLARVLGSGPAPLTRFAFPLDGFRATDPEIEVEAELSDEGGGIGRVEWRVNGVTVSVAPARGAEALEDDAPKAKARVALEPGQNVIEVLAYNAAGLLASAPRQVVVTWDGVATTVAPNLYVLSVGVNDYADGRLKLTYAAADARAFGAAMDKAGAGLFGKVEVVTLLDAEVTAPRLEAAFADLAARVQPQDVFLFFLAGHGKTVEGSYYFIPQDFRFQGDDPIRQGGIGQDRWQDWAARIKARKAVMIYDTCESGSLTGTRSVDAAMAQTAAVERLTRAMGRTVLSASTDDAPALEGYRGHGVMTYALLEAMGAGDANGNATIEVTELAGWLDVKVPEISAAAFGLRQVPQMSIRGSDFAVGSAVAVLEAAESFPATLTHVVAGGTAVLDAPGGAEVSRIPEGGFFGVYRAESRDGFARIARDGKALGWVAEGALMPLQ